MDKNNIVNYVPCNTGEIVSIDPESVKEIVGVVGAFTEIFESGFVTCLIFHKSIFLLSCPLGYYHGILSCRTMLSLTIEASEMDYSPNKYIVGFQTIRVKFV